MSMLTFAPAVAHADPCTAPIPARGTVFSGIVRYVGDGDSLCIGPVGRPDRWIEVRLADFNARELGERGGKHAREVLRETTFGHRLTCRASHRSYDRVVARCTMKGRPLGNELRRRGGIEGGR